MSNEIPDLYLVAWLEESGTGCQICKGLDRAQRVADLWRARVPDDDFVFVFPLDADITDISEE